MEIIERYQKWREDFRQLLDQETIENLDRQIAETTSEKDLKTLFWVKQMKVEFDNERTELKNFLSKFGRDNCPQKYYTAWKVLVLGTSEYKGKEYQIIERAYNEYKVDEILGLLKNK